MTQIKVFWFDEREKMIIPYFEQGAEFLHFLLPNRFVLKITFLTMLLNSLGKIKNFHLHLL